MKIRIDMLALAVAVFLLGTFTQCKKSSPDEEQKPDYSIDPAQANELSKVIKFGNAVTVSGALPTTTSTNAVTITHDPSMSVSTGGATTYLPLVFEGAQDVQKAFIIVKGATIHYFSYSFPDPIADGIVFVPMTIPKSVNSGAFSLQILLVGANNIIIGSKKLEVPVGIKKPIACSGYNSLSGSDGITQTLHALDGKAGNVTIEWETYSIPDRIDVFLDGKWVAGTGSSIAPPPPLCYCDNPLPSFVGEKGTFTIPVSSSNQAVEVYVSGCLGGGTAWDYTFKCP